MLWKKWLPLCIIIVSLIPIGYYESYTTNQLLKNGRFSICEITRVRIGKGGNRTWVKYSYKGINYDTDGIIPYEFVSLNDVGRRLFIQFLPSKPKDIYLYYKTINVPDSIMSAPDTGWSVKWMEVRFPKVIESIHIPG
jgi:hypothetical protein